ncbi:MAG: protein kinase [Polyangiaceae bacterium]|nr:protein kinase [Polyangiaceae bacterium]
MNTRENSRSEPTPSESLPRRFGRLVLLQQVAKGGMGEVFLGTRLGIEGAERPCVVKLIRREHEDDASFLARFLDEARVQAALAHPGVAQVLEADLDEAGRPYVVVEHVEGRNLGEVRTRATQLGVRLPWPDVIALGVQLGEALAHVHHRTDADGRPLEIAHRDLSPQNVMVGYAGDTKLIDFGTARGQNRRSHTVAGVVFAKPGYVAPEVAQQTPGGAPADLYAYGVMLWELLAGRRFLSGDSTEHMAAVARGDRCLPAIATEVRAPAQLDEVLARLTATRIEDRYASARDAVADLVALLVQAPSLADGERGVRARVARMMERLYPAEPGRSRAEFQRLVEHATRALAPATATTGAPPAAAASPAPAPALAPADDTLLPGTSYRLLREIGRGSTGVVHEALHTTLGRRVAVKVLAPELAGNREAAQRIVDEARVVARIEHENVVRVHDAGFAADGRAFVAMELIDGRSLDEELVASTTLDWREAARIGVAACRALEAAHAAGVVHRDMKPQNLLLARDGRVLLVDFGIASHAAIPARDGDEALTLVGTPEYMAPEQIAGGAETPRADLYALGVVLFEALTGHLPHDAASPIELLDSKRRVRPPSPSACAPNRRIPKMIDKTISRSLEMDESQRFESAARMRESLESALGAPTSEKRRTRWATLSAVGVAAFALAGGLVLGVRSPELRASVLSMVGATPPATVAAASDSAATGGEELAASDEAAPESDEPATGEAPSPGGDEAEPAQPEAPSAEPAAVAAADGEEESDEAPSPATDDADPAQGAPAAPVAAAAAPAEPASADEVEIRQKSPAEEKAAAELARAAEMLAKGQKIRGMQLIRKVGRNNRKDAEVLKTWSETAAQLGAWGEALRVAKQWAEIAPGVESHLHLARMQRATGKREQAIQTLARVLEQHPKNEDARMLMRMYEGSKVARR